MKKLTLFIMLIGALAIGACKSSSNTNTNQGEPAATPTATPLETPTPTPKEIKPLDLKKKK